MLKSVFIYSILISTLALADDKVEVLRKLPGCGADIKGLCVLHVDHTHPTQFNVGMYHAGHRLKEINKIYKAKGTKSIAKLQLEKTTEFIIGPESRIYINDRHHFSTAILKSEIPHSEKLLVGKVVADYSSLSESKFWEKMTKNGWAFLKDRTFTEVHYSKLPASLSQLNDNPMRSLVSEIFNTTKSGKIAKRGIPFEEFYYAEFLSKNGISVSKQSKRGYKAAVKRAEKILLSKKGVKFRQSITVRSCARSFHLKN